MSFKRIVFIFIRMCYIALFSLRQGKEEAGDIGSRVAGNPACETAIRQGEPAERIATAVDI